MLGFFISILPFIFFKDNFNIKKDNKISIFIYLLIVLGISLVITRDFTYTSILTNLLGVALSYKLIIDIIDNKLKKEDFKKLLLILGIYLGINILLSIILTVYLEINHINPEDLSINTSLIFELLSQIVLSIIYGLMYKKELLKDFKDFKKNYLKYLPKALGIFILAILLSYVITYIITYLTGLKTSVNESIVQDYISVNPLLCIVSMGILAPFIEEIVFRKSHYDVFKYNKVLFIIASGITFGMAHVIFSATTFQEYLFVINYILLGSAIAKGYADSENYFTGFTIHAFNNIVTIIISLL